MVKITITVIVAIWEMYFDISGIPLSPISTNQQNVNSYTWFILTHLVFIITYFNIYIYIKDLDMHFLYLHYKKEKKETKSK